MTEVIVMTAYGTIESAVEAMRLGAFDYIQKPFTEQELLVKVQKALEQPPARGRGRSCSRASSRSATSSRTSSAARGAIREVLGAHRASIAPTDATVLITGESGTGKELVARGDPRQQQARRPPVRARQLRRDHRDAARERALRPRARRVHRRGQRAQGPVRGGRRRHVLLRRDRRDARSPFQAKLLRAIQEGEIRRVGENKPHPRSTCASSPRPTRTCSTPIAEKRFRQDLYYRLNVARFSCRRCASGARTSRCSSSSSSRSTTGR